MKLFQLPSAIIILESCWYHGRMLGKLIYILPINQPFSGSVILSCGHQRCLFLYSLLPLIETGSQKGTEIRRLPLLLPFAQSLGKDFTLKSRPLLWRRLLVYFTRIIHPFHRPEPGRDLFRTITVRN